MAPREEMSVAKSDEEVLKHPFFGSARMSYTLCAFIAMLLHHAMRGAVNFSILCMISKNTTSSLARNNYNRSVMDDCEKESSNNTDSKKYSGDLQWNRDEEVLFPGIFYYGYVAMLPLGGILSDKYGGKVLFIGSISLESTVFLLIPMCARSSFWFGAAVRALQGVIAGAGNPAIYELYTVWSHPTERTASIAFGYTGFNIANLITYPICAWLCTFGWDTVFYVIGGFSFTVSLVMNWLVYDTIDEHPRITPKEYMYLKSAQKKRNKVHDFPWKSILTSVPFYIFTVTHFCHTFGVSMEALMLPRFLKESMNFPLKDVGTLTSVIFLGSFVSKILTVIASSQIEKKTSINLDLYRRLLHLISCWSAIPFIFGIIMLTCKDRWLVVAFWICVCIGTDAAFAGGYFPSISFMAPSYAGLLIGIANCVGSTGTLFVPIAVAKIVPNGTGEEWVIAIGILIGIYFIDGLLFCAFGTTKLQSWNAKPEEEEDEEVTKT